MLLDANILICAVAEDLPHHGRARTWLTDALDGDQRIALPWQVIGSFLRITTNPRIGTSTFDAETAWGFVQDWLDSPVVWIPSVGERTAAILGDIVVRYRLTADLIPDAQLAALAIEHGIPVASADTDFARFPEVRWINPLA